MIKIAFITFLLIQSAAFCYDDYGDLEIDIGYNYPTGDFDKYAANGISFRCNYSHPINGSKYLKWQTGAQYINFERNHYIDNFTMDSGFSGPSVNVLNSEQVFIVNGGVRFTREQGIFNSGTIKPYFGSNLGVAFFSETTRWSWNNTLCPDNFLVWLFLNDLCDDDNDNSMVDYNDSKLRLLFNLDFGLNIIFNKHKNSGLDIGVRYNVIPDLNKYSSQYSEAENGDDVFSYISRSINADYYTFYIGWSYSLN